MYRPALKVLHHPIHVLFLRATADLIGEHAVKFPHAPATDAHIGAEADKGVAVPVIPVRGLGAPHPRLSLPWISSKGSAIQDGHDFAALSPNKVLVRLPRLLLAGDKGSAIREGDNFAALTPGKVFVCLPRLLPAGDKGVPD